MSSFITESDSNLKQSQSSGISLNTHDEHGKGYLLLISCVT